MFGSLLRIVAVLGALGLSGCAFTQERISIDYSGAGMAPKVEGAAGGKVEVAATDVRVQRKVGTKKNGYGMEMASIDASNDLSETVRKAIASELAARGYTIAPGGATVAVQIVRFYNDFKVGFFSGQSVADVTLNVSVTRSDGSSAYSQNTVGQGINGPVQILTGANAEIALERALQDVVVKLMSDPGFTNAVQAASRGGPGPALPTDAASGTAGAAPAARPPTAVTFASEKTFFAVRAVPPQSMIGQKFYLCCNMTFDGDNDTTDANYLLADDTERIVLPLGSEVTVTEADDETLQFTAAGRGVEVFEIALEYGASNITADRYFPLLLRPTNPADEIKQLPPETVAAIRDGQVVYGMSRAQTAMARGLPPLHQTTGLDAATWLYYDAPGMGKSVSFADDRVTTVRNDQLP